MSLLGRVSGYFAVARYLHAGGVRLRSIFAYPFIRRLRGVNELVLADGRRLRAPRDEPLLSLFREVWVEERYTCPAGRLEPDATIVDIGANVGVFTVWAAGVAPRGRVVSVEPSESSFTFLEENVARNALTNVSCVSFAVGGSNGRAAFFSRGPGVMNTLFSVDNYGSRFQKLADVDSISLETLFARHGVQECDLLKLDCEGAEYEILLGAPPETLRRVRSLAIEYHVGLNEHSPAELVSRLGSLGFETRLEPLQDVESGYLYAWRPPDGSPAFPRAPELL